MADTGSIQKVVEELIASNQKLDLIATNTEIAAEATIDLLGSAPRSAEAQGNGESKMLSDMKDSLDLIARRMGDLLYTSRAISARTTPMMEDISAIYNTFAQWYGEQKNQSKLEAEMYGKFKAQLERIIDINAEAQEEARLQRKKDENAKAKAKGVAGLVGLGALLVGFVQGFVSEITKQLSMVTKSIGKFFGIDRLLLAIKDSKIFKEVTGFWYALQDVFRTRVTAPIKALVKAMSSNVLIDDLKALMNVLKNAGTKFSMAISSAVSFVSRTFKSFTDAWKEVTASFTKVKSLLGFADEAKATTGFFTKAVGSMSSFFTRITTFAKTFFGLGKSLGTLLGKIAIPLTVIMGIFDSVTGFIKGFNKSEGPLIEKILSGVVQGVKDLIMGLIGGIIDLVKGAIAWILDAVGLDSMAEWLRSWSFKDVIESFFGVFDKIGQMIGDALVWLINSLEALAAKVKDFLPERVRKFLGMDKAEGPQMRTADERGAARNEQVLQNGAKTLASPEIPENVKAKTRSQLMKNYGFTAEEVDRAVAVAAQAPAAPTVPAVTAPPAPTVGAEMNAIQRDTAEAQAANMASVVQASTGGSSKTVNNSTSSVVYNNSNMPDRTSWQMTPAYALG